MGNGRTKYAPLTDENRTRLGTGRAALVGVDGRTSGGRRFRELVVDLAHHVGGDPTAAELALIRRAAALQIWCEAAEAAQARGEPLDVAAYSTAANTLRRLVADLGLARRAKDVTPAPRLDVYLAAKRSDAS